ncbi:ROK family protein [Clostridium sediminicola]|uniref:ROK family protein n=1 Tax=Clostridium sediminicola TaxID=3114879 RepID=UPI0031F1D7B6
MKKYIGIDIGGTEIKAGIVNEEGKLLYKITRPSNINNYKIPLIDVIKNITNEINVYTMNNDICIEGVGVSAAGQIDNKNGVVIGTCGNIPGWKGTHIKSEMEKILHLDVIVENDANCAALAEHWIGNGKEYTNMIAYTIGTGIGGGIILDNKIFSGSNGIAGEIGHIVLEKDGEPCTCGNKGCFEQYGSMTALIKNVKKIVGNQLNEINGKIIFEKAKEGNKEIAKCIDHFLDYNATGIVTLLHIFNPEAVIIGGGVSKQGEVIIQPLIKKVKEKAMPAFYENVVIKTAKLSNDAGMIGAVKNYMNFKDE